MIAIALTALAMFGLGLRVWLEVAAFGHRGVKLSELPRWLEQAHLREGRVGDLVSDFASCDSLDAVESRLASVQASQIRPLERELKLMKVCVARPHCLACWARSPACSRPSRPCQKVRAATRR